MVWGFSTPEQFDEELAWVRDFVDAEIEPADHVITNPADVSDPLRNQIIRPLQAIVKDRGLWALHLDPQDDDSGHTQVEFVLLNLILGRSRCAPAVFGCQTPDAANMELLQQFASPSQRERFLKPLFDGETASCFSATEPTGGSDPTMYLTTAVRDRDEWVLRGEKWFSSGLSYADFALVVAVTAPEAPRHERLTMFIVPTDSPGIEILRQVSSGVGVEGPIHAYVRYDGVRLADDLVIGTPGKAFGLMQQRLGRARLALAARCIGQMEVAFESICERVLSRSVGGQPLAETQLAQELVAETWTDIEQFRLLVLRTAWKLDMSADRNAARGDIAAVKSLMPEVMLRVARRAAQIHGSLGVSDEMSFIAMAAHAMALGVADGPTEVHKLSLGRLLLREHRGTDTLFPSRHLPARRARAEERYADLLHVVPKLDASGLVATHHHGGEN